MVIIISPSSLPLRTPINSERTRAACGGPAQRSSVSTRLDLIVLCAVPAFAPY